MKEAPTIIFLIFTGSILIYGFAAATLEQATGVVIYHVIGSIVAIFFGLAAVFFTAQINELNARYFAKLHRLTSLSLFKKMSDDTRSHNQYIVTKGVGIIITTIGVLQFCRYIWHFST